MVWIAGVATTVSHVRSGGGECDRGPKAPLALISSDSWRSRRACGKEGEEGGDGGADGGCGPSASGAWVAPSVEPAAETV